MGEPLPGQDPRRKTKEGNNPLIHRKISGNSNYVTF